MNKTRMRCEYTIKYGYFYIGMLSRYHEEAYLLSNSFYAVDLMTLTRHPPGVRPHYRGEFKLEGRARPSAVRHRRQAPAF